MENLYNKASLVLTPQMVEAGKVYSMKPEDRKGDFTFTRASAATRVNADGNIEKETQNLLKNSGDLTQSQWQNIRTTDVSGQGGYDGTNNALKIIPTTDNNTHRLDYVDTWSTSQVYTFSFYAKASGYDTIDIVIGGSSVGGAYGRFNLSTGTASNVGISIATSMEDVGSGWYRCQVAQVSGSTTRINIGVNDGTTQSYAGDGTSGVLIQHPQLEQGLVARDYIETTTAAVYGGITDNTPRLDYTDSSCPALLLEPLRTNFVTDSEYFAGLNLYGSVNATYGAYTNPSGEDSAYLLAATSAISRIQTLSSSGDGNDAVMSIFIKGNSNVSYPTLANQEGGQYTRWEFDANNVLTYDNGDAPTGDYGQEDYGNGWYRIWLKTDTANSNENYYRFNPDNRYGTGSLYAWGFQVEKNSSYLTSYIPTYGSSVTRGAEQAVSNQFQSKGIISSTQGTIFFDVKEKLGTSVHCNIQNEGGLEYALRIQFRNDGAILYQKTPAAQTTIRSITGLTPSRYKIAMSWNGTNLISSFNGTSYINTIDASIASQLNQILRPNINSVSVPTNKILVFPTQLTEAELNALTTI